MDPATYSLATGEPQPQSAEFHADAFTVVSVALVAFAAGILFAALVVL